MPRCAHVVHCESTEARLLSLFDLPDHGKGLWTSGGLGSLRSPRPWKTDVDLELIYGFQYRKTPCRPRAEISALPETQDLYRIGTTARGHYVWCTGVAELLDY